MPAQRIGGASVNIAIYDVLGFDSPHQPAFVGHVAIAAQALSLSQSTPISIRVTHMVPPLLANAPYTLGQCHGAVGLEEVMMRRIATFVRQIRSEYEAEEARRRAAGTWNPATRDRFRADQYTIRPHVRWPDGTRPYHQFSCAGFVAETYGEADIVLVETREAELPPCYLATLKIAYSHLSTHLDDIAFLAEKGLDGEGPWRILLPGYIMNSLGRSRDDILATPYQAVAGDEFFPSKPPIHKQDRGNV